MKKQGFIWPENLRPLIILGAARSGTKFLRNLLAADPTAITVPYDVNYVWMRGQSAPTDDVLDRADFTPERIQTVQRDLLRLARPKPTAKTQFFIEKTCHNTLRVPVVARVFPQAQFIHLIRDGRDVVASALQRWTAPPEPRYLLRRLRHMPLADWRMIAAYWQKHRRRSHQTTWQTWGPRYPSILEDLDDEPLPIICAKQWQMCVEMALDGLAEVPPDRVFTLRYEALIHDPKTLTDLLTFLDVPNKDLIGAHYTKTVRNDASGHWQTRWSADLKAQVTSVIGPLLARLGYSITESAAL